MSTYDVTAGRAAANTALQQMDAAYGAQGYVRVGSQYIKSPAQTAAEQAAGSAAGTQSQFSGQQVTPTDSSNTGIPIGTNYGQLQGSVAVKPLTPNSADVSDIGSAKEVIDYANQLKDLINSRSDLSEGSLQHVTNLIRLMSGNRLLTSESDKQFMSKINSLKATLANGEFGQRLTSNVVGPNGAIEDLLPSNTLEPGTNLQRLNELITHAQNTLKQSAAAYPQYGPLFSNGNGTSTSLQGGQPSPQLNQSGSSSRPSLQSIFK